MDDPAAEERHVDGGVRDLVLMREFLQAFQKLEFDKIKRQIGRYTLSDMGREAVDKLFPSSDNVEINNNLSLVTETKRLIETDDPLPIDSIPDVRISLQRSTIQDYILSGRGPTPDRHINTTLESSLSIFFQEENTLSASRL